MINAFPISALSLLVSCVAASSIALEGLGGHGAFTFTFDAARNGSVSSTKYYVPPIDKSSPVVVHETITWTRGNAPSQDTPVAFTVLSSNETIITAELLSNILSDYLADDVYSEDFFEGT